MPDNGHRHRLVIYTYMLNRWWRAMLAIGITLLLVAGGLGILPVILPQYPFPWVSDWKLWVVAGAGAFAIFLTVILAAVRKSAYVQPFGDRLRMVTPFLRLDISYRRIRRTYTTEMQQLFPPNKVKGWKRGLVRPLARQTVIMLELAGYPVSRTSLRLFLSPLFFPDQTTCLALLVPDWIAFSTELESLRGVWQASQHQPINRMQSVLSNLPTKPR